MAKLKHMWWESKASVGFLGIPLPVPRDTAEAEAPAPTGESKGAVKVV